MAQNFIAKFVAELKAQQDEIAKSVVLNPRDEPLAYGVLAGRYQGIQNALDTLDNILRDDTEENQS